MPSPLPPAGMLPCRWKTPCARLGEARHTIANRDNQLASTLVLVSRLREQAAAATSARKADRAEVLKHLFANIEKLHRALSISLSQIPKLHEEEEEENADL